MKFSTAYLPDEDRVYLAFDKFVTTMDRDEALQLADELRGHASRTPPMLTYLEVQDRMATTEEISLYFDGKLPTYQATVSGDANSLERWIIHRIATNTAKHGHWVGPCHGWGALPVETAVETRELGQSTHE